MDGVAIVEDERAAAIFVDDLDVVVGRLALVEECPAVGRPDASGSGQRQRRDRQRGQPANESAIGRETQRDETGQGRHEQRQAERA